MYGAVAVVLVVAVVAVAYGSAAPSLGVAEFSPSAAQGIEAPPTSTGSEDLAAGGRRRSTTSTTSALGASGSSSTAAELSIPTTKVGRARACVGTPPRQIEDPMSPPCMATIFEGDNGGATSRGVSGTEIRVGIAADSILASGTSAQGQSWRAGVKALFEYANRHFELYGRRLVPVLVEGPANTASTSRALGSAIAAQSVFGALAGWQEVWSSAQVGLVQELARSGVVTITRNAGVGWSDRQLYDPFHPFVWSVYPSTEDNQSQLGEFACGSLAGRPAIHAVDAALRPQTRRFGIVALGEEVSPATGSLVAKLEGCGESPVVVQAKVQGDPTKSALRTGFQRLVGAGVTTVFCVCEGRWGSSTVPADANTAGFNPEWIVGSVNGYSDELASQIYWAGRPIAAMRLDPGPKLLPVQQRPWFNALTETDSTINAFDTVSQVIQTFYESVLLLASGIQAAGPSLTPDTFAAGLMGLSFPNPGAGQAPNWQPSAGFGPGDHAFYDDYALSWWSPTAPTLDRFATQPQGSWCYVNAGARFRSGTYTPAVDALLHDAALPCR